VSAKRHSVAGLLSGHEKLIGDENYRVTPNR
jgi:hypothetical protein